VMVGVQVRGRSGRSGGHFPAGITVSTRLPTRRRTLQHAIGYLIATTVRVFSSITGVTSWSCLRSCCAWCARSLYWQRRPSRRGEEDDKCQRDHQGRDRPNQGQGTRHRKETRSTSRRYTVCSGATRSAGRRFRYRKALEERWRRTLQGRGHRLRRADDEPRTRRTPGEDRHGASTRRDDDNDAVQDDKTALTTGASTGRHPDDVIRPPPRARFASHVAYGVDERYGVPPRPGGDHEGDRNKK